MLEEETLNLRPLPTTGFKKTWIIAHFNHENQSYDQPYFSSMAWSSKISYLKTLQTSQIRPSNLHFSCLASALILAWLPKLVPIRALCSVAELGHAGLELRMTLPRMPGYPTPNHKNPWLCWSVDLTNWVVVLRHPEWLIALISNSESLADYLRACA